MRCPFCNKLLDKHKAGFCMDAWVLSTSGVVFHYDIRTNVVSGDPAPCIEKYSTNIDKAISFANQICANGRISFNFGIGQEQKHGHALFRKYKTKRSFRRYLENFDNSNDACLAICKAGIKVIKGIGHLYPYRSTKGKGKEKK